MAEERAETSPRREPLSDDVRNLLEGLDTGDLVLFDRPCLKMGSFFGAAICAAAKVVGGSPFDHIGVVVKDENGLNTMVEASFSGVAIRPLCERVRMSSASQICVRRLQAHRTEEMREEARRFVSEVAHLPYKEGSAGLLQMVSAALRFHPAKEQRRRVHAEAVALSASIANLERELEDVARQETGGDGIRHEMAQERLRRAITRRRKALVYLEAANAAAAPAIRSITAAPPTPASEETPEAAPAATASSPSDNSKHKRSRTPSTPSPLNSLAPHPHPPLLLSSSTPRSTPPPACPQTFDGGLFCSELVAALYQRLGLLDIPFPASHEYVPADFAQCLGSPVDCVGAVIVDDGVSGGGRGGGGGRRSSEKENRPQPPNRNNGTAPLAAFLPPPIKIPEGGERVALLRGAALGPGRWLRGGPPALIAPPGGGDKEGRGGGEEEEGKGRVGGGRGRADGSGSSIPPGVGQTETSPGNGRRPSQRIAAAAAAAAAFDDAAVDSAAAPLATVAVLGFMGTEKGAQEFEVPLVRDTMPTALEQQRQHPDRNVGDTCWRSRLLLLLQQSLGDWLLLPEVKTRIAVGTVVLAQKKHAPLTPFSLCWHPPPSPVRVHSSKILVQSGLGAWRRDRPSCDPKRHLVKGVSGDAFDSVGGEHGSSSSSFLYWQPVAIVTTSTAAAFAAKTSTKPFVFGRGGLGLIAMALGGAAACFSAGAGGFVHKQQEG